MIIYKGEINLMRVDVFLQEIGSIEEVILRNNARKEEYFKGVNEKKAQTLAKANETAILADKSDKNRSIAAKLKEELNNEGNFLLF